jgi:hypothetical protein
LTPFVPEPEVVRDLVAEQRPLSVDLVQAVTVRLGADVCLLLDPFEESALDRLFGLKHGRVKLYRRRPSAASMLGSRQ